MKRELVNEKSLPWLLLGGGVAAALYFWSRKASAAGVASQANLVPVAVSTTAPIADWQYAPIRADVVKAINEDEATTSTRMSAAQIDTITQAWIRQDAREVGALRVQLSATGYSFTAMLMDMPPFVQATPGSGAAAQPTNGLW
jgi:hypothetical protein